MNPAICQGVPEPVRPRLRHARAWLVRNQVQCFAGLLAVIGLLTSAFYLVAWQQPPQSASSQLYGLALRDHFFEYVTTVNLLPPLNYAFDKLLISLFGHQEYYYQRPIVIALMMSTAIVLLYLATQRFVRMPRTVFAVFLVVEFALVSYGLWDAGTHYDHLTFALVAVLACLLANFLTRPTLGMASAVAALSALLILQSSVAFYTLPPLLVVLLWTVWRSRQTDRRQLVRLAAMLLVLPALACGLLMLRAYRTMGILSPGTKGGGAMMMHVANAYYGRTDELRQFLVDQGAPAWYLHGFDTAQPPTVNGVPMPDWVDHGLHRTYGYAAPLTRFGDPVFPFDFSQLLTYLEAHGPPEIAAAVARDADDSRHRQYLFAGTSPEMSPRWIALYGKVSSRMTLRFALHHPIRWLREVRSAHQRHIDGPGFLAACGRQAHARLAGQRGRSLEAAGLWLTRFFQTTYLVFLALIPSVVVTWLTPWRWSSRIHGVATLVALGSIYYLVEPRVILPVAMNLFIIANLLCVHGRWRFTFHETVCRCPLVPIALAAVLMNAAIFSAGVGGENDRYFVQAFPWLALLLIVLIDGFGQAIRELIGQHRLTCQPPPEANSGASA